MLRFFRALFKITEKAVFCQEKKNSITSVRFTDRNARACVLYFIQKAIYSENDAAGSDETRRTHTTVI